MSEMRHYTVTGMSCAHCEGAIRQEVSELHGVEDVQVSAAGGTLTVTVQGAEAPSDGDILAAVDEAGYEAVRAS